MQIFPSAKWWNTPLTTQPMWSPNAPYILTLRPNSGLDCLSNVPPWLNWFHLPNTVSGSATCVSYFMGMGSTPQPRDLEDQGTSLSHNSFETYPTWVAILPPWLLLAVTEFTKEQKTPHPAENMPWTRWRYWGGSVLPVYLFSASYNTPIWDHIPGDSVTPTFYGYNYRRLEKVAWEISCEYYFCPSFAYL